ncbi:hypothetical protein ADK52_38235 [Streptomyces sp. WM6372]|nr:hypothetical protein ADK52_38235 [Streptomyces sp. WM6372]
MHRAELHLDPVLGGDGGRAVGDVELDVGQGREAGRIARRRGRDRPHRDGGGSSHQLQAGHGRGQHPTVQEAPAGESRGVRGTPRAGDAGGSGFRFPPVRSGSALRASGVVHHVSTPDQGQH